MPELPDVESFRKYFNSTSLHQKIKDVSVKTSKVLENTSARKLKRHLIGSEFISTNRHGKYLFANLNNEKKLAIHFGMTGEPYYLKDMEKEPEHDRCLIDFSNGYHFVFDCQRLLGKLEIISDQKEFIEKQKLGPDAADVKKSEFKKLLNKTRGAVKSLFLNQSRIAGLGNVYADEILFQAGVHPEAKCSRLSEKTKDKIFRTMKRVLETAIKKNADKEKYPEKWLILSRYDDQCPKGHGKLSRTRAGGRNGRFCPECQKTKK